MKTFFYIFLFLFTLLCRLDLAQGQNQTIDSLLALLKVDSTSQESSRKEAGIAKDTNKVKTLNVLSEQFWKNREFEKANITANKAISLANLMILNEGKDFKGWLQKSIARSYHIIGSCFLSQNNYSDAMKNFLIALKISEKNNDKHEIADAYYKIGTIYTNENKYADALKNYFSALRIYEELKNKKNICHTYTVIGIAYESKGNYPDALKNYFSALKIREEIGDKEGIASSYNDIGLIYWRQGKYADALKKYFSALEMFEKIGEKNGVATTYSNIGLVYEYQGNYTEALKNQLEVLKTKQVVGDKQGIADSYNNVGMVYESLNNHSEALKNHLASLKIREEIGDKVGIAGSYINLGETNAALKNFSEATKQLQRGLSLSKELGNKEWIKDAYVNLSTLDSMMGNYKASLAYYKMYVTYRDSMFNEENTKKSLQAEMDYQFEKKQGEEKLQQGKKDMIDREEKQKQKNVLTLVSCFLILLLVFSVFIYNRFRVTQMQKKIIETQKYEVDDAYLHLGEKNKIIEEKNKDITDSINYAKRIQDALLKEEEHVTAHFPSHFILFKPKDIVSGDFYWGMEKQGHWYLCIADCTGHGVPGAFMSMLGISFLNEINAQEKLLSPAEILDQLRDKIVKELKQTGEQVENKDGMDISMMRFNLQTKELQWAGANNPLYIIKASPDRAIGGNTGKLSLVEYSPDKQPIGFTYQPRPFINHIISTEPGDSIYLFSDGYADQFGGPNEKKFKYKQFQEVLLTIFNQPVASQKEILNNTFENWRGKLEQVDDVAIIGIKL